MPAPPSAAPPPPLLPPSAPPPCPSPPRAPSSRLSLRLSFRQISSRSGGPSFPPEPPGRRPHCGSFKESKGRIQCKSPLFRRSRKDREADEVIVLSTRVNLMVSRRTDRLAPAHAATVSPDGSSSRTRSASASRKRSMPSPVTALSHTLEMVAHSSRSTRGGMPPRSILL